VGVVHFGPGAFHRAHQAWYFDRLMERDPRWAITGVSLKSPSIADALEPQEGLYVLAELEAERSFRVIGSITGLLVATRERERVLQRMASPHVGWVSATITEKGYCLDGAGDLDLRHADIVHDIAHPREPESFIGYVVEGMRRRRAAGGAAPVVVSCDNLTDNGVLLKRAVVQFAHEIDPDLAVWIEGEARFPRTMVDSITPATDDHLRELVRCEVGVHDAWPVQRERFVQWVIEDCLPEAGPDIAGVGVTIAGDVGGFERAKLRLLNGAHSALAYLGLLRGHETVADAMADAGLADFIENMMRRDIAPLVHAPAALRLGDYITAVLDRFRNRSIRHLLSQIAWDGSKKLPFRLLETITQARVAGRPIERLSVPIAAWMVFVRKRSKAGEEIVDPLQVLLTSVGHACGDDPDEDVERFLRLPGVFPASLARDQEFRAALSRNYAALIVNPGTVVS
jgi:fructuronate reductase